MNEVAWLRELAFRARAENAPPVHVAQRVLQDIAVPRREPAGDVAVALSAALSLAAAALLGLIAFQSWTLAESPAVELFHSLQLVLQ